MIAPTTNNTEVKPIKPVRPVKPRLTQEQKLALQKAKAAERKAQTKQLGAYIKLQTVLSFKSTRVQSTAAKVIGWILKVLVFVLAYLLLYVLVNKLTYSYEVVNARNCLVIFFTFAQLLLLIYSISLQIKRLHKPDDLRILSTFPMTSFYRYLGEIISIYLRLAIFSFVFFFPFLLVYGGGAVDDFTTKKTIMVLYPAQYIFSSLFATILLPLLPFSLSLVISVPFMFLSDALENKNVVKLVLFIIVFIAILVLYALILDFIATSYVEAKTHVEVIKGIARFFDGINNWYNPCYFNSQIALFTEVGKNLGIYLAIIVVLGTIGIAITKPLYHKFTLHGVIEGDASVKPKQIKTKKSNPYVAIFAKEIKEIIRTPAYAYFYLGVAVSMPVMTYLITNLVTKLGESQVGSSVFFGFAMLTLFVIISLIGAYSGSVVSREGKQFYITKLTPLSYRRQLFTKALVNFTVAFIGLVLCTIVLGATSVGGTKKLSIGNLFLLFGASTFFLIGVTFNGVNLDVAKPKIDTLTSAETNETNVMIQLVIGLVISSLLSMVTITIDTIVKQQAWIVHLGAFGLVIIYALVNFLIFFFTSNDKYREIELK